MKNSQRKTTRIEKFSKSFDNLWNRARNSWQIIGCRDSTYLNWRYVERPNIPYTIFSAGEDNPEGFIVLTIEKKNFSNVGIIVDFLYMNDTVFNALLLHALRYFISKQIDYVLCWAIKDGKEYDILCKNGFSANSFDPVKMVYKILDSGIDPSFLKNHTNWLITYGDSH